MSISLEIGQNNYELWVGENAPSLILGLLGAIKGSEVFFGSLIETLPSFEIRSQIANILFQECEFTPTLEKTDESIAAIARRVNFAMIMNLVPLYTSAIFNAGEMALKMKDSEKIKVDRMTELTGQLQETVAVEPVQETAISSSVAPTINVAEGE